MCDVDARALATTDPVGRSGDDAAARAPQGRSTGSGTPASNHTADLGEQQAERSARAIHDPVFVAARIGGDAISDASSSASSMRRGKSIVNSKRFTWLLGREVPHRLRTWRTLIAAAVYALSILFQWSSTRLGLSDSSATYLLVIFMAVGVTGFYAAIRSGFSLRFRDPALTLPQMGFAIVAIALGYLAKNGESRAILPILAALVLLFGAFTLQATTCHRLGWAAVGVFAVVMGGAAFCAPARFDPLTQLHHFVLLATVLPTISYLAGQLSQLRIDQQREKKALRTLTERLTLMATHDQLTGLPNRRHVEEWMARNAAGHRGGRGTCIALLDLDEFKKVNDRFGHAIGDEVLRIFAGAAPAVVRQGDVLARWGGEEFLLVMPDASIDEARIVLDRYRLHLADPMAWGECLFARVTFSAGIALVEPAQKFEHALQRADTALYDAKRLGRDRACEA